MSYVFCLTIEKVNYVFSITSLIWIVEKYLYILGITMVVPCPYFGDGAQQRPWTDDSTASGVHFESMKNGSSLCKFMMVWLR